LDLLTPDNIRLAAIYLAALILSITVHEFGHAWVATRLGDPLPASQGRVTLNPRPHIDLIGTIALPLIMFFSPGGGLLGWGRPVQTNRLAYTRRIAPITGHVLVSLAGPMMNLLLVAVVSLLLLVGARVGLVDGPLFTKVFRVLIGLNFVLFFLNLLPIPPLDGGALLEWAFPRAQIVPFLARWGFLILLALSFTRALSWLLTPAAITANAWESILMRAAGL
jgi:Zn-dependent protease